MPNEHSIIINLTLDPQKSEQVLKTFSDFNKSLQGVSATLDELDKKGLTTFDKLLNLLSSSRTGDAAKKVQELGDALKGLFVQTPGGPVGQAPGRPTSPGSMFSASGRFDPQSSYAFSPIDGITSGGDGLNQSGTDRNDNYNRFTMLGEARRFAYKMAPFVGAGLTTTAAFRAADMLATGQIAESQAAQLQRYQTRAGFEAASGDISLSSLKTLGVGLSAQAGGRQATTLGAAYATEGLGNLLDGLKNVLTLNFATGFDKIASVFNPELMRGQYIKGKQDTDKALYAPIFEKASQFAMPIYNAFNQTYRLYGQEDATNILSPLLKSGKFTTEDLAETQNLGLGIGIGAKDINTDAIGTQRRFMYSSSAAKTALTYGYGNRNHGRSSVEEINSILRQMGTDTARAETPLYSDLIGQSGLANAQSPFSTLAASTASIVEASKIVSKENLTPEMQVSNIQDLSKLLKGSDSGDQLDAQYFSIASALRGLGITNPSAIGILVKMFKTGQGAKAVDIINNMTGKKLSLADIQGKSAPIMAQFLNFRRGLLGDDFNKAAEQVGGYDMTSLSAGLFIPSTGKVSTEDFAMRSMGAAIGATPETSLDKAGRFASLIGETVKKEGFAEVAGSPVDIMSKAAASTSGDAISVDEQLTRLGSGIANEVASGLEATAARIRKLPDDIRKSRAQTEKTKAFEDRRREQNEQGRWKGDS